MRDVFYLAWRYLRFHRGKSLTLWVCLTVALALPTTVHRGVGVLQEQMVQRAGDTPVVVGASGSRFDLALHALYFEGAELGEVRQAERFAIDRSEMFDALAIPLFVRYEARGYPIVGTSLDYFEFRGLKVERGSLMTMLGDVVVGSEVAGRLGLEPGDRLLSDPENIFELGGEYPLNMRVTGVLEESHSPDDAAVFVDVRTAWIIAGIGHGHDEEDAERARGVASTYHEITAENVGDFHFHMDEEDRPLTAIIAVPGGADDAARNRSRALLLGEYMDEEQGGRGGRGVQAVVPTQVVEQVLGMVVQIRRFFDVQYGFLLAVMALFVGLVMMLSLRLRRQEVRTMYHLGCSRGMILSLQATELGLLLALSALLAWAVSWAAVEMARGWIGTLTG